MDIAKNGKNRHGLIVAALAAVFIEWLIPALTKVETIMTATEISVVVCKSLESTWMYGCPSRLDEFVEDESVLRKVSKRANLSHGQRIRVCELSEIVNDVRVGLRRRYLIHAYLRQRKEIVMYVPRTIAATAWSVLLEGATERQMRTALLALLLPATSAAERVAEFCKVFSDDSWLAFIECLPTAAQQERMLNWASLCPQTDAMDEVILREILSLLRVSVHYPWAISIVEQHLQAVIEPMLAA